MLSPENREKLIQNLLKGKTIIQACEATGISRDALYRLFQYQADLKKQVFDAMDQAKKK